MRVLASVGRVVAVAAVAAVVLFAAATAVIRQPIAGLNRPPLRLASPERLRRDVELLATTLRPRDVAHVSTLDVAAAFIANEFAVAGARVTIQDFTARKRRVRNVIAELGPATSR